MLKSLVSTKEKVHFLWKNIIFDEKFVEQITNNFLQLFTDFVQVDSLPNNTSHAFFYVFEEMTSNFKKYSYNLAKDQYENYLKIATRANKISIIAANNDYDQASFLVYEKGRLVLRKINNPAGKSGVFYRILASQESEFTVGKTINISRINAINEGFRSKRGYEWINNKEVFQEYYGYGSPRNVSGNEVLSGGLGVITVDIFIKHLLRKINDVAVENKYDANIHFERYGILNKKVRWVIEIIKK